MEADILLNKAMLLGEGPTWDHRTNRMYCVDILNHKIHFFDEGGSNDGTHDVGKMIGFVVPAEDGRFLCGLEDGIALFHPTQNSVEYISKPEEESIGNRFNDGKCDSKGRVWCGTMNLDESIVSGNLYRVSGKDVSHQLGGIGISNGLDWSLDNKTFYYIDTPTQTVKAFDFDLDGGTISGPRVVINVDAAMGFPDGMTVDSEGMLWIAHWGGFCVRRWDPHTGKILQKITVPAPQPTSCCFGGKNLDTLYITSARKGLDDDKLKAYPYSGSVFVAKCDVKGRSATLFKI